MNLKFFGKDIKDIRLGLSKNNPLLGSSFVSFKVKKDKILSLSSIT